MPFSAYIVQATETNGYAEVGFRTGKMKLDILKVSEKVTFHKEESSGQIAFFLIVLHLLVGMFRHCNSREYEENYLSLEAGINTDFRKQCPERKATHIHTHTQSL